MELQDEAGLGLDEVRILVAATDGLDLHLVASDFARERGQVFGTRDDVHGGIGRASGTRCQQCDQRARQ